MTDKSKHEPHIDWPDEAAPPVLTDVVASGEQHELLLDSQPPADETVSDVDPIDNNNALIAAARALEAEALAPEMDDEPRTYEALAGMGGAQTREHDNLQPEPAPVTTPESSVDLKALEKQLADELQQAAAHIIEQAVADAEILFVKQSAQQLDGAIEKIVARALRSIHSPSSD